MKVSALGVEEQRVKVRVSFVDLPDKVHALGDRHRIEARITTWYGSNVLKLTTAALFRRGNDWTGFVVEGGKARLKRVEIDHKNNEAAEVRGGLAEGQFIPQTRSAMALPLK